MNFKDLNLKVNGYCTHWFEWEAIREIATNARDVYPENWSIRRQKKDRILTIWNGGNKVLMPHHFIMGEHQAQRTDVSVIGKFGEGLKVGITVLLRLGYRVEIASGKYRYYAEKHYPYRDSDEEELTDVVDEIIKQFEAGELDEIDEAEEALDYVRNIAVSGIHWEEVDYVVHGTEVTIRGWHMDTDYKDRFLTASDKRIVHEDEIGRRILRESTPNLYVGGVFVSEMPIYFGDGKWAFGYDLSPVGVKLDRDRNAADFFEIKSDASKVWGSVTDDGLWELFFKADDASALEGKLYLSSYLCNRDAKKAMSRGFNAVHGKDSLIETNRRAAVTAENDGKNVVKVSKSISDVLEEYVDTDVEYLMKSHDSSEVPMLHKELTATMRTNLRMLKRRSDKVTSNLEQKPIKWEPFIFDEDRIRAKADQQERFVYINLDVLDNRKETYSVLVEELAHIMYGTKDNTREHVNACCNIAAELLMVV